MPNELFLRLSLFGSVRSLQLLLAFDLSGAEGLFRACLLGFLMAVFDVLAIVGFGVKLPYNGRNDRVRGRVGGFLVLVVVDEDRHGDG